MAAKWGRGQIWCRFPFEKKKKTNASKHIYDREVRSLPGERRIPGGGHSVLVACPCFGGLEGDSSMEIARK